MLKDNIFASKTFVKSYLSFFIFVSISFTSDNFSDYVSREWYTRGAIFTARGRRNGELRQRVVIFSFLADERERERILFENYCLRKLTTGISGLILLISSLGYFVRARSSARNTTRVVNDHYTFLCDVASLRCVYLCSRRKRA